jgi:hypothetical protein
VTWTNDIVVRLEAAAEDLDVLSPARLETLLREAVRTIRTLRTANGGLDGDGIEPH